MKLRYIPCNLCGSSDTKLITIERSFNVCKCKKCGLVYVNPQPYQMEGNSLGQHDYWDAFEDYIESRDITSRKEHFAHTIRILERVSHGKRGKLLDVGCGYGHFLKLAKEKSWKVTGQDISRKACEYAKYKLGVKVYHDYLENIRFPDSFFDIITMLNVLEHTGDPFSLLTEGKRILNPSGILLVRVPNISILNNLKWLIRKAMGKHYPYLCDVPPAHLYGFTPKTIRMFLEKLDFDKIKFYPTPSTGIRRGFEKHCLEMVTTVSTLATGRQYTLGSILVSGRKK